MSDDGAFDAAWRENRAYLVDLAFRMLRDIGEAEDTVQMAFAQLLQAGAGQIDDARAWLTVVTSRLCLNRIKSAQRRREQSAAPDLLADVVADHAATLPDPADRVTLDDRVRLALLLMLERLTPAERVAFVLHDVFGTPFDVIAASLGRPQATCRQLARRARQRLADADGRRLDVAAVEHREITERFIAACAGGDLDALIAVLDPDATGDSDYGPRSAVGAQEVAAGILRFWSGRPGNYFGVPVTLVSQPLGDQAALLAYAERRLLGAMLLTIAEERVRKIHVIGDAGKLAFLAAQLQMPEA